MDAIVTIAVMDGKKEKLSKDFAFSVPKELDLNERSAIEWILSRAREESRHEEA